SSTLRSTWSMAPSRSMSPLQSQQLATTHASGKREADDRMQVEALDGLKDGCDLIRSWTSISFVLTGGELSKAATLRASVPALTADASRSFKKRCALPMVQDDSPPSSRVPCQSRTCSTVSFCNLIPPRCGVICRSASSL